eukprot:TRINITY_DN9110_c0_g2_i1.p1 TRINITY_DN9110_c0_g2~~TRINITY_DN9110_c0_g2_i1.p1  ORF type:complete len:196 (+),score=25.45 TRINITY_DN9110_c0_g2_i1:85-588(+)
MSCISCGTDWDVVRKSICSAYFHNAARLKGIGEYVNLRSGMPCYLHPTSSLYGLGHTAEYVVYHELVYTTKEYMRSVTAVEPQWLAELGPMFFSIKESHRSRVEKRKREKEMHQEMEKELEVKLEEDKKEEREKVEHIVRGRKKQKICTLGKKPPGTPKRTPLRLGL